MADGGQHRRVVGAVGIGVARGEVDAVLVRPRGDRGELPGRPHERSGERAVVEPVVVDRVPRGHDVVEPETVGERLDEVVRRGRGEHDRPAGGAMCGKRRLGERLDHADEPLGNGVGRLLHGGLGTALGERDRLAGERHRRQRLADRVEHTEQHSFARESIPRSDPRAAWPRRTPRRCTAQQRAVEIEERRTPLGRWGCGGTIAHRRHTTSAGPERRKATRPEKRERPGWGIRVSQPGNSHRWGIGSWVPFEWNMGGVHTAICLLVKVCT